MRIATMAHANPLPLVAKRLATVVALVPALTGAVEIWRAANHREPDPGPGNMPSFFPTALVGLVIGVILVLWSLPQLAILASVWRGRAWAFLTSAVFCLVQGVLPLLLLFLGPGRSGSVAWAAGAYGALSLASGVALILARNRLPPRAAPLHGFPLDTG